MMDDKTEHPEPYADDILDNITEDEQYRVGPPQGGAPAAWMLIALFIVGVAVAVCEIIKAVR